MQPVRTELALPALRTSLTPALSAAELSPAAEKALNDLAIEGGSEHTARSYRVALRYWAAWFYARYRQALALPLPEAVVLQFIVDHAGRRGAGGNVECELPADLEAALLEAGLKSKPGPMAIATLAHRITVLSRAHARAGIANPCQSASVREALTRAKRAYAKRGQTARKKPALTRAPLEAMLSTCDDTLKGKRDRALLLFAWSSGGRRRSEVSEAVHENLRREGNAYLYELGSSKTNQAALPRPEDQKPVAGVAARALDAWIAVSGKTTGPIFRRVGRGGRVGPGLSSSAVRDIVKARCVAAGLDAAYSAHSLRSGFVTEAGRQGVALGETMALTGHRSVATVSGYHRAGAALESPAARLLDDGVAGPARATAPPLPRIILDKNFVEGGKTQTIVALCREGRAVMPDVLFYEMLTGREPGRSRCFAKFPGENPVTLVPNVGELLQYETARHSACGKPSRHALRMRFQFNSKLADGAYELPAEAKATLEEEELRLRGELANLVEMINMAPALFPDAFNKERDLAAERKKYENALVNDPNEITEFYGQLEPPDDAVKPAPAALLTDEWIHFRWLQVKLWASLDLRLRLGQLDGEITGERRHRLENFLFDMQYGMLGILEGGLATKDQWLRDLFKLFRPDGLLLPSDEEIAASQTGTASKST